MPSTWHPGKSLTANGTAERACIFCLLRHVRNIQNSRVRKALTVETLVQKRAMVSAFLYAFFIEGILSTLPATINHLTISFRLRSMLAQLLDLNPPTARELDRFFDTSTSVPMHLLCLSVFVALRTGLSLWRDQASQFAWQSET